MDKELKYKHGFAGLVTFRLAELLEDMANYICVFQVKRNMDDAREDALIDEEVDFDAEGVAELQFTTEMWEKIDNKNQVLYYGTRIQSGENDFPSTQGKFRVEQAIATNDTPEPLPEE